MNEKIHLGQNGYYKIASQLPFGEYDVELLQLALVATSDGLPAVMMTFMQRDGSETIATLHLITNGFQVHFTNERLRDMTAHQREVEFHSYIQYAELIHDVAHELINRKFRLKYSPAHRSESIEIEPLPL